MKTQDAKQGKTGVSKQSVWSLSKSNARIESKSFTGSVDITQPESGIQIEHVFRNELTGTSILGFSHTPSVERVNVDQYVRGDDLVCRYRSRDGSDSASDDRRLTDQVYWSHVASETPEYTGIELVVSLQTDRLDLQPRIELNTQISAERASLVRFRDQPFATDSAETELKIEPIENTLECDPTGAIALLVQNETDDWSYLQGLHFTDEESCDKIQVDCSGGQVKISVLLFVEHLEKGVIRRARLRGSFMNSANVDQSNLTSWFDAFAASELPLTV